MGTPIRQVVKRYLSPKNVSTNLFNLSPNTSLKNSPTKNLYSISVNNLNKNYLYPKTLGKFDAELGVSSLDNKNIDEIKIKISKPTSRTDLSFERKIPYINTPEKGKILNFGITEKDWRILGRGQFGTVFQGFYKDELVAVKVVSNKNTLSREKNCVNLKHDNIVEIIQIISEPLKNFGIIFMKYYKNSQNLQVLIDDFNCIISKEKFGLDICKGLEYCHKNWILHLDIKPGNILIDGEVCRICDFGNSVNIKNEEQFENLNLGTVYYTAPELFRGEAPTEKCDVYSLGVTLWQMDSREIPYKDIDNHDTIIYEVVKNNKRPESEINQNDLYKKLYEKCWDVNPNSRPTIIDIIKSLNAISKSPL